MVGGGFKASALCDIYCRLPNSALALQPLYFPNPLALFNYEFLIFHKKELIMLSNSYSIPFRNRKLHPKSLHSIRANTVFEQRGAVKSYLR